MYRLIVHLDNREPRSAAPKFRSYKAALAHVAAEVRRHTRNGAVRQVSLQRSTLVDDLPGAADTRTTDEQPAYAWTTIDQWGPEVISRIVGQNGAGARAATASPKHATRVNGTPPKTALPHWPPRTRPRVSTVPESGQSTNRMQPVRHHRSHRWHVGLTVVVVVGAWIVGAYLLTGGRMAELFAGLRFAQPTAATELPFEMPPAESPPR